MIKKMYQVLQSVIDPDTGVDVVTMGLADIQEWDRKTKTVTIRFAPTSPMCPMAFFMTDEIRRKLKEVDGISKVVFIINNFDRAKELQALVSDPDDSTLPKSW